ncbi:MAG: TetR/AcrR family transcriptional regulator [Pedobacter sp.]|nr:MAG: TetR/AcrR family transcriptional regulator [Pedobacter sp.]
MVLFVTRKGNERRILLDVKDYIITEADVLFGQYGFKSVTMDDIAKHLGISKKTIYLHFADKDELVTELLEGKLNNHSNCLVTNFEQAHDAVHEVFLGITQINDWLNTLNAKLFYDLQKYHPKAWLKFKKFKEQHLTKGVITNLNRGIKEGLYRENLNIDIIAQIRLDHGNIIFNQHDQYMMNKYSMDEVMKEVTYHFLYGICSKEGIIRINEYKERLSSNKLNK